MPRPSATQRDPLRMIRLSAAGCIVEDYSGERPSPSTMHRWASRGLHGVTLRTAYAGGCRRTTDEWIREFFAAVTAAKTGESISPPTSAKSRRQSAIDRAKAELADV
ncbi:DUF1580 domain-containing protein [Rhodopirellula bahusiensis]|uniref:DUF1580 domain-containing protein n=2 Tax=Rhodopirellula bahusiensis TaxID=2014065 RepID=UPI0032649DE7